MKTTRPATSGDVFGSTLYASTEAADRKVVDTLQALAAERGVPAAQIAIAWQLTKPYRHGPDHRRDQAAAFADAVAATELKLSPEEIARLETPYVPHPVLGFK